jgi:uncharacterized protein (UPF0332 family)
MTDKQRDLSQYRFSQAEETIQSAHLCENMKYYKDAINRAYYAAFYAVKAVLAISDVDFKRHKDVVAYFNQNYVATEIFEKDCGRKLARLQKKREASDYDDFYLASADEAKEQIVSAEYIIREVKKYLTQKEIF